MTQATDKVERFTLWSAIKDLGWFPLLFAVAVGGPSILAILESVLVEHQLVPTLQWIVDGYSRIMAVLGAIVEPIVQPALDWINARLGWELRVDPVWRPMFALNMIIIGAILRAGLREGDGGGAVAFGTVMIPAAMAGALVAGLLVAKSGWIAQGVIAAVPFITFGALATLQDASARGEVGWTASMYLLGTALSFALGAALSLVPSLTNAGGLFALGGAVFLFGVLCVVSGVVEGVMYNSRIGLMILGGFAAAGLVLGADNALKALGNI